MDVPLDASHQCVRQCALERDQQEVSLCFFVPERRFVVYGLARCRSDVAKSSSHNPECRLLVTIGEGQYQFTCCERCAWPPRLFKDV